MWWKRPLSDIKDRTWYKIQWGWYKGNKKNCLIKENRHW